MTKVYDDIEAVTHLLEEVCFTDTGITDLTSLGLISVSLNTTDSTVKVIFVLFSHVRFTGAGFYAFDVMYVLYVDFMIIDVDVGKYDYHLFVTATIHVIWRPIAYILVYISLAISFVLIACPYIIECSFDL